MSLYKTATVAPGRTPANLAIYSDADQYYDMFHGKYVFDLINGYGCDPTGATECSANVLAAISDAAIALNSSVPNSKSALIVGYGTLKVNQTIRIASDNIMLEGLGGGEVSHMGNGLCFKKDSASFTGSYIVDFFGTSTQALGGCRVKNVVINGNGQGGTNIGGLRFSSFNGTVEDVHIGYCSGVGLEVAGAPGPPTVWHTYNTCLSRVWSHNNLGHGFYINPPSTDGHATDIFAYYNGMTSPGDSTPANTTADGFNLNSSGWQLYGYHAYSNTRHGLNVVGGILASQCSGGYLENNLGAGAFFDNTSSGATGYRLVNNFIWDNGRGTTDTRSNVEIGTAGTFGTSVIVSGNHIRANANTNKPRYGVDLFSGVAQNCIVTDNYIEGTYTQGLVHANGSTTSPNQCLVAFNRPWNPRGNVAQPGAITASPFVWNVGANGFNEPATVYITAGSGTISIVQIAGVTTGMTITTGNTGVIRVMPGQSIGLTYSGTAPSWSWFLD